MTSEERQKLLDGGYQPHEVWLSDFSDPATRALAEAEAKRIAFADSEEDVLNWLEALQKDMWEGEDQI
jgi:hypothetical protein